MESGGSDVVGGAEALSVLSAVKTKSRNSDGKRENSAMLNLKNL